MKEASLNGFTTGIEYNPFIKLLGPIFQRYNLKAIHNQSKVCTCYMVLRCGLM